MCLRIRLTSASDVVLSPVSECADSATVPKYCSSFMFRVASQLVLTRSTPTLVTIRTAN